MRSSVSKGFFSKTELESKALLGFDTITMNWFFSDKCSANVAAYRFGFRGIFFELHQFLSMFKKRPKVSQIANCS